MKIRRKPANRFTHQRGHNQYGIYNWFKKRGITNSEDITGCIEQFCWANGFEGNNQSAMLNYVQNRFGKFAAFAAEYTGKAAAQNQIQPPIQKEV